MYGTKKKLYAAKAAIYNYPEIKTKVKVATNTDPWGPTTQQMQEICNASFNYEDKRLIMRALFKRLTLSDPKDWRHILKALTVIEFLLINGPDSIVTDVNSALFPIKALHEFKHEDEKGRDQGAPISLKSRRIVELVSNSSELAEARSRSAGNKSRIQGLSAHHTAGFSETNETPYDSTPSSTLPADASPPPSTAPSRSPARPGAPRRPSATNLDEAALGQRLGVDLAEQAILMKQFEQAKGPTSAPAPPAPPPPPAPPAPSPPKSKASLEDLFESSSPVGASSHRTVAPSSAPPTGDGEDSWASFDDADATSASAPAPRVAHEPSSVHTSTPAPAPAPVPAPPPPPQEEDWFAFGGASPSSPSSHSTSPTDSASNPPAAPETKGPPGLDQFLGVGSSSRPMTSLKQVALQHGDGPAHRESTMRSQEEEASELIAMVKRRFSGSNQGQDLSELLSGTAAGRPPAPAPAPAPQAADPFDFFS
eukprot:NODE_1128_length_1564_cov_12.046205_g931_i0.p1 GENE.NODE_1128_length_1564_cov_12.046205_g931_i0~~NODE_1128_length_1564_cov_12.046205_g931_i0.p1  ORF type:complete len:481 (+),score=65.40 NODE_1128_length_1564_cov_12.046205_g931_i0:73-1515(+)